MLGSRPIEEVIDHADAFVVALAPITGVVVDLGSGGGVPGLVIAQRRGDLTVVLVDRRATRTDHLRRLVLSLGLQRHVEVVTADAADLLHRLGDRPINAVVARGFGPPERTLRTARRLLGPGGRIVISEPPTPRQWDAGLLAGLRLTAAATLDRRVAVFDVSRGT